jgi:hypothetical protein
VSLCPGDHCVAPCADCPLVPSGGRLQIDGVKFIRRAWRRAAMDEHEKAVLAKPYTRVGASIGLRDA